MPTLPAASGAGHIHLVVVEDDTAARAMLVEGLELSGWHVVGFDAAEPAARYLETTDVDVVLLDIMLPGKSGLTLLKALRSAARRCVVICVTALDSVEHRVAGLEAGADDYIVKPLSLDEVRARVQARIRGRRQAAPRELTFGDLVVDLRGHVAQRGGANLALSQKELHLLTLFVEHQGQVLGRDFLLSEVWGVDGAGRSNVLDVNVRRLREKLEDGNAPQILHTVRGQGYVLR